MMIPDIDQEKVDRDKSIISLSFSTTFIEQSKFNVAAKEYHTLQSAAILSDAWSWLSNRNYYTDF